MSRPRQPGAVGDHIRRRILPKGMTVTEAAERLGVTRVALSNLLNGKASLSRRMALRLKAAFGADEEDLFRRQEESLRERRREEERKIAVRSYVPPFLRISAARIHAWADKGEEARSRLPVLLRRLIRSTGSELGAVDFPGYGESQRSEWDGRVVANSATRYIPKGRSGWELGTGKDPRRKANRDFAKRRRGGDGGETVDTFVFVSSRNWPGKDKWAKARRRDGPWENVLALDASDLEQWLEESIEGQVWMAEQLGLPSLNDCMTLDRAWREWSEASGPPMSDALFAPAVAEHRATVVSWLKRETADRPLNVAADSMGEALAFLSCLFRDEDVPQEWVDLAVVVNSSQTLKLLAPSTSRFIPIVAGKGAERELAALYRKRPCIVVRPRNAVDQAPDVALGLLRPDTFRGALSAMELKRDEIDRLVRVSGRSPTVLRRRLSSINAIREPWWAEKAEIARKLVPMVLVGAWHAASKADQEVLGLLADKPFRQIEEDVAALLVEDDSPVWSVGRYRGIVSKFDGLFALHRHMTSADLRDFLFLAEMVLSEGDPAIDPPRDRLWTDGLDGKVRKHSNALRTGICETLVLFSVHGADLFQSRLGFDVQGHVSSLAKRLLKPGAPLTEETLESYDRDLPMLAEAAPEAFLSVLEEDLDLPESAVRELLKPVEVTIFKRAPGVGLLWALECLAWKPNHLARVVLVLASLPRSTPESQGVDRPLRSLEFILRSWMPQTAATLEQRIQVLRTLCDRVPEVGWHICMQQLARGLRDPSGNYRPKWRGDAAGAGWRVSVGESREFIRAALDRALDWPIGHDASKLGDLVDNLGAMLEPDRARVWSLVEGWLAGQPAGSEQSDFRERLRRFAFPTRGPLAKVDSEARERAKRLYERLRPADPIARHAWLFARYWIEEWPEDTEEAADWRWRETRAEERRTEAMREILKAEGLDGALRLLPGSEMSLETGRHVSLCLTGLDTRAEALRACVAGDLPAGLYVERRKLDDFVSGFVFGVAPDARAAVLARAALALPGEQMVRLFVCAPFDERTWRAVEEAGEEVERAYWREVRPHRGREFTEREQTHLVDRLLEARRPRAAFFALSRWCDSVETSRLKDLFVKFAADTGEVDGDLEIERHLIASALKSLDGRAGVTRDEMAQLEFAFFEALRYTDYDTTSLDRRLAGSPGDFVWMVALAVARHDGRVDPEGRPAPPELLPTLRRRAWAVLAEMSRIPGTRNDELRPEALHVWVEEARRLGRERGRPEQVDFFVGKLLSRNPPEGDAPWPARPICEVLEAHRSSDLAEGFVSGAIEARGVAVRFPGDSEERDLAARYRQWASRFAAGLPFVGRILKRIARFYDGSAAQWDDFDKLGERLGG
ncbi:MAG: helix-turn-helix domain-containing protein [Acidobacteriota bacterium]|nr:helix-turn-helix domain-containing protein [Acidobacteriota bacterium]